MTPLSSANMGNLSGGALSIARHTIQQCLRMRVVGMFLVVVGLCLGVMPFAMTGDGTLTGRLKSFLTHGSSLLALALSILTIFLSIWVVTEDVRSRQVFSVAVKPVSRWQYILGRWLGICLLDAALLLIGALMILGLAQYLRTGAVQEPKSQMDRQMVETQVFTARRRVSPEPEDIVARVEARIQEMKVDRTFADALEGYRVQVGGDTERAAEALAKDVEKDITSELFSIAPGQSKRWRFRGLEVQGVGARGTGTVVSVDGQTNRLWIEAPASVLARLVYAGPVLLGNVEGRARRLDGTKVQIQLGLEDMRSPRIAGLTKGDDIDVAVDPMIQLTYTADMARQSGDRRFSGHWQVRSPAGGDQFVDVRSDLNRQPVTLTISARVVDEEGRTDVTFKNLPNLGTGEVSTVTILPEDVAILFRAGTFGGNFLRGMLLLMLQLMYLAAVGVFAGSFLIFPVACLLAFSLLPFSLAGSFLRDAVDPQFLPQALVGSYWIVRSMGILLPDFESTAPGEWFVRGMAIPWRFVGKVALLTLVVRTNLLLLCGCVIFTRRELARVQV